MTTRIGTGGPNTGVSASATAARVTAAPGQPFKAIMQAGAGAILSGAEQAVTRLPGGPILAAALRPAGGPIAADPTGSTVAGVPGGAGALSPEGAAGSGAAAAGAGGPPGVQSALDAGRNDNLAMLEIQIRVNQDSQRYSAMSNVLKAQHDTVKNAIGNIR